MGASPQTLSQQDVFDLIQIRDALKQRNDARAEKVDELIQGQIGEMRDAARTPEVPSLLSGEYEGPTGTVAPGESLPHAVARQAIGGVGRTAKGLVEMGVPTSIEEAGALIAGGPGGLLQAKTIQGQLAAGSRAAELAKEGRASEAAGFGLAAATPIVGPMVAGATEQAARGSVGPAAELAGLAALPLAVKGVSQIGIRAGKAVRIGAQELVGAGREPVQIARESYAQRLRDAQAKYAESARKSKELYAEETAASEQAGVQKDIQGKAQYEKETAEINAAHAEKTSKAMSKWLQEVNEARGLKAEAAKVEARKESIGAARQNYLRLIGENVRGAHARVRESLSARWDAFRDAVGRETPLDGEKIYNSIAEAQEKYLKGSPDNIKVFKDLLSEIGVRKLGELSEMSPQQLAVLPLEVQKAIRGNVLKLDLDTARVHSSAIGERRYAGDLPGNVYQSLKYVQNAIEGEIGRVAALKGQGKTYAKLKTDWAQYMKDWNDMRAIATGGSPLARVLRAQDPAFVSDQILGKAGDRLLETAGRYSRQGASTQMLVKFRNLSAELKALPKVKVPTEPARPVIERPQLPEAPQPSARAIPTRKEVPIPRIAKEPRAAEVRTQVLLRQAGRPLRWWELLFPPYLLEHLMLKSPEFRQWVATQPRTGERP